MALIDYITEIQFDFGALNAVAAECARVGISRPFNCTDRGVVAAGLLQRLTTALDDLRVAVYDGTPFDLAKAVAIPATHAGPLARCATIEEGSPRIGSQVAPLIAIPTTAGTGSDVARGAIIIVDDGRKLGFHSWHLVPKGASRDPELPLGLPAGLTAATGMDAMAHCIETYLSRAVNPPADAIAFDGPRRARGFIERAVRDGSDHEARWQMMSASDAGRDGLPEGPGNRAFAVTFARRTGAASASRHVERAAAAGGREVQRRRGAGERARHCRHVRRRWQRWAHRCATRPQPSRRSAVGTRRNGHPARGLRWRDRQYAGENHCHATSPRQASAEDCRRMLEASFCQAAAAGLPAGREKATSVDWALVGAGRLAETVRLGWFGTSNVVETRLISKTFHPFLGCVAERAG